MFFIEFKEIRSTTMGVAVTRRPDIPAPQPRGEFIQVAGRDGSLFQTDGTFDDIPIPIPLNFVRGPEIWMETYRRVKNWITGAGKLKMSDDPEWFYKCKSASIQTTERRARAGGFVDTTFICDPYQYQEAGQIAQEPEEVLLNPYATAKPIFYITGEGVCALTVNGTTLTANVGQNLTVDTDRMVAYRTDKTIQNTAINAGTDYTRLWLQPGKNEIEITNGFALKIAPNWRSL